MIIRAVVIKLATDDGLVEFTHCDIGREYLVEVESIRRGQQMVKILDDEDAPIVHHKDIIFTIDGTWLPLELVKLVP